MRAADWFEPLARRWRARSRAASPDAPLEDAWAGLARTPAARAFSDLLPYAAWSPAESVFYLEGARPGTIDGIGFALELTPQTGATAQMAAILASLFTGCPRGTGLQVTLFATGELDAHLAAYVGLRPDAGLFGVLAARRAAFYRAGTRSAVIPNRPYRLRHLRLALTVILPCASLADRGRLQEAVALREAMIGTLRSVYLFGHVWDAADLVNWCALVLNPQQSVHGTAPALRYDADRALRDQIVAGDTLQRVSAEGLRFGMPGGADETVVKAFSVRSYPPAYGLNAMGALLGDAFQPSLGYPCPFVITLGVRTLDVDATRHAVTLRSARATQVAGSPMARFQPDLQDRKHDWDLAQRAFDAGGNLVWLYHQVLVLAPAASHTQAEHAARAVWRARGFELTPDTYMQVQALLGALPLTLSPALQADIAAARRFSTKTVMNAVHLAPFLGEWTGQGAPVIPLFGRRGQAMGIDLFANRAGNYNAAVVGTSGAGKSAFMAEMALAYLGTGARVWIIDVGRSYQKLCHTVGGTFIAFAEGEHFSMNPFALVEDLDEDMEMLRPVIAQMASPAAPLDAFQRSALDVALRTVWAAHGRAATLTDLARHLERGGGDDATPPDPRIRDLGLQLAPYTAAGTYGRYFDAGPPLAWASDFVVLELEELKGKKDLQAVVLLMLMYRITRDMYLARDRRKLVLVDEAWELLRGAATGEFLEAGYRRARKYNGAFVTGTQSIEDYAKSPAAQAALENADWVFLLRQKPESLAALEATQRLPMTETLRATLRSLQTEHGAYAEVFVYCPMGHGVGLMLFDPFSLLLFSSRAEDMVAVDAYRARGLPTEAAIEQVLADRGQGRLRDGPSA